MILEKISNRKLKITFRSRELTNFGLFGKGANSPELRAFLINLVKYTAKRTGFETNGTIMVESLPSNGKIIFLITSLSENRNYRTDIANRYVFFTFRDLKTLSNFLCTVKRENFSDSALYTSYGKYYFKTPSNSRLANNALEFSNPIYSAEFSEYIKNHTHLICKDSQFQRFL